MIKFYRNHFHAFYSQLADRLQGRKTRPIGIIGGACGPSAVFIASHKKFWPLRRGRLSLRPEGCAVKKALLTSFAFAALVTTLATVLYRLWGGKR